jgi:hypothetical protein
MRSHTKDRNNDGNNAIVSNKDPPATDICVIDESRRETKVKRACNGIVAENIDVTLEGVPYWH